MQVTINTNVTLSPEVLLDILNVAINGGCEGWAVVSEKRQAANHPQCVSARFSARDDASFAMVVSQREIGAGIELALASGSGTPLATRAKILRVVAANAITEVDLDVANFVVRAVMNRFALPIAA